MAPGGVWRMNQEPKKKAKEEKKEEKPRRVPPKCR